MTNKEDKFFEMFQDSFQNFAPAPPASVYAGVRQKMKWAGFLGFHYSTFNVWYVGLILAGSATIVLSQVDSATFAGTADVKATFDQDLRVAGQYVTATNNVEAEMEETADWNAVQPTVDHSAVNPTPVDASDLENVFASATGTETPVVETAEAGGEEIAETIAAPQVVQETAEAMTELPMRGIELGNVIAIENDLVRQLRGNDNTIEFAIKVKLPVTEDQ
jgi:hypothetical protein